MKENRYLFFHLFADNKKYYIFATESNEIGFE